MILDDVCRVLDTLNVPYETGEFSDSAPEQYIVIVPLSDTFSLHADNLPNADVQEVRLTVFSKTNYIDLIDKLVVSLLLDDFTITDRHYIGYDSSAGYHQYVVDAERLYS